MLSMEQFKEFLRAHNLKATAQRLAVHEAMVELGHASADMVSDYIAARGHTRVTAASVYNILSQFALQGVYKHRLSAGGKMFFDVNPEPHIHLYDLRNGEFRDIEDEEILDTVQQHFKRRRFRGYKVDDIDIQLICHPTRKTNKTI